MSHDQLPIPSPASLPGSLPTVSIVIPAFNEQAVIERCLEAAMDQTMPAHEILVIDNRSTDDTAALARRVAEHHPAARIRVIAQDAVQGLIPTRNAGFAAATGDVLGRIDADTVVGRDWVSHVARAMADPAVGAMSGPVAYYDLPFRGPQRISDDMARRALRRLGSKYPFLYGFDPRLQQAVHQIEPGLAEQASRAHNVKSGAVLLSRRGWFRQSSQVARTVPVSTRRRRSA